MSAHCPRSPVKAVVPGGSTHNCQLIQLFQNDKDSYLTTVTWQTSVNKLCI